MSKKQFKISFESVEEVEERKKTVYEQLRILEKQEQELKKSIAKLEAELKLLENIECYMRGEYEFVGNLE